MKHVTTTLTLGMLLLAGTTLADHHGKAHHGTAGEKPCHMKLGADGKPSHKPGDKPCPMKMDGDKPCPMKLGADGKPAVPHHMGMDMHAKGDQGPSSQAYAHANMTMHQGMDITFTGDADIDFLRGMIAHHQGAVDMANVQLQYGRDPQVKRMAMEIIRAQNLEIRWMQNWLKQLEAKGVRKADANAPARNWSDSSWAGKTWLGER